MRCWWCGAEPLDVLDVCVMGQSAPIQRVPRWPDGDHEHAVEPPSPAELVERAAVVGERLIRILAAALVVLALTGCPRAEQPAAPVQPGAYCDTPGEVGRTTAGTQMECKGPGELRWRQRS